MSPKRQDSFVVALDALRNDLREGAFGYGARLTATDIAHDLRLSPTPVREALSRLVGEGLVEDRRGQGFFVPRLTARDLADLYRLNFVYLSMALGPSREDDQPLTESSSPPSDGLGAVILSERLFQGWVSTTTRLVVSAHQRLQGQLAFARRFEPQLIPDLIDEVMALIELASRREGPQLRIRLEAFHARRVDAAPRLAALLESHSAPRK